MPVWLTWQAIRAFLTSKLGLGLIAALLLSIIGGILYYNIRDGAKNELVIESLENKVQQAKEQNEKELEVHSTINRVVTDPAYRNRVRQRYDAGPPPQR